MQTIIDYHVQMGTVLAASLTAWCVFWVWPRFGFFASALLCYLGLNSIWFWVVVDNRYVTVNPYDQMAIRYFAADSFLKTMVILVPLMLAAENQEKLKRWGVSIIAIIVIGNASTILARFLLGYCKENNSCGGLGNPSLIVSMMICALPFLSWWAIPLVALAALASHSSIAVGLFLVFFFFYLQPFKSTVRVVASGMGVLMAAGLGYFLLGTDALSSSGRFALWKLMAHYWNTRRNIPFGTGFGTYHVFSIHIQNFGNFSMYTHWNWMHNDWFQLVFEGGAVAGFLALATYTVALLKSLLAPPFLGPPRYDVALSLFLYGIFMFFNPALHYPLPMLFGAWLFVYALRRRPLQFSELPS